MGRTKKLNIVVTYGNTEYVVNDLGQDKSPRFELYNLSTKTIKSKSDNPNDFYDIIEKIWEKKREEDK